jgi:hypothetical protein
VRTTAHRAHVADPDRPRLRLGVGAGSGREQLLAAVPAPQPLALGPPPPLAVYPPSTVDLRLRLSLGPRIESEELYKLAAANGTPTKEHEI